MKVMKNFYYEDLEPRGISRYGSQLYENRFRSTYLCSVIASRKNECDTDFPEKNFRHPRNIFNIELFPNYNIYHIKSLQCIIIEY